MTTTTSTDPALPRKVLHVLDHSLPHRSGYAFRARSIFEFQRRLGFEPVAVTSSKQGASPARREEIDGVVYHRTNPADLGLDGFVGRVPFLRDVRQMRRMRRVITELARREGVEIIHAHSPSLNGVPARAAATRLGLPMVYEIRAFWEDAAVEHGTFAQESLRYKLSRYVETRLVRRADMVIVICEGIRGELIRRGIDPEKIAVVPNGVDADRFVPREPDQGLIDRYGLRGKTVLGFLGSFYRYEGLPVLLEAMTLLRQTHPDARLLLVGGGPEEERVRARAAELGLLDRVLFAGSVPPAEVHAHYSIMDALVYPRTPERLTDWVTPLKPLEAMAMKKVVVASDVGGLKELVNDGETGFLFRAGSAEGLARKVAEVLANRERMAGARERAREFVIRQRGWAGIISRHVEVYRQAQSNSKRPARTVNRQVAGAAAGA